MAQALKRTPLLRSKTRLERRKTFKRAGWKVGTAEAFLKPKKRLRRKRVLKPKSDRQIQLDKLDELLRQVVLLRDGFRCRRCGGSPVARNPAYAQAKREIVLQAAHIYGKGAHPAMRFALDNVLTLCRDKCHMGWWHRKGFGREASKENEIRQWCIFNLGAAHMNKLDMMAATWKKKKMDLAAERLMLEQELKRLTTTKQAPPSYWTSREFEL